jgi:hypothetical protein
MTDEEWGTYKSKVDKIEQDIAKMLEFHRCLRDQFDKVYAKILVEYIVFTGIGLVLSSLLAAGLTLVLRLK